MPIQFKEEDGGKILVIQAKGKLTKANYEAFLPEVDLLIQLYGTLHVLVDMNAFHGWDVDVLWEDIQYEVKHIADIKQMAINWRQAVAGSSNPIRQAVYLSNDPIL